MKQKRTLLIITGIIIFLLLALFVIYWFYFAKPNAFPSNEQLQEQMNEIFPEAKVETIQDTVKLDTEHIFVPFRSSNDNHGAGYWVWVKHKWKPTYISTDEEPTIWKANHKEPSTTHIVWNLHPDDDISKADFFIKRKRNYFVTDGNEKYFPPFQMKESVNLKNKSYGVWKLPTSWGSLLSKSNKFILEHRQTDGETDMLANQDMYFGWMPFNDDHEITYPEHSTNGSSYTNSNIDLDFVRILEEVKE